MQFLSSLSLQDYFLVALKNDIPDRTLILSTDTIALEQGMNWTSKIHKGQSILNSWSKRDLGLFAKIQIIKTFALSQFVLPATVLVVTPEIVKQIETMLYRFFVE